MTYFTHHIDSFAVGAPNSDYVRNSNCRPLENSQCIAHHIKINSKLRRESPIARGPPVQKMISPSATLWAPKINENFRKKLTSSLLKLTGVFFTRIERILSPCIGYQSNECVMSLLLKLCHSFLGVI